LSSGRRVWGIGVDDTHDFNDLRRTATGWTMVDAVSSSADDVLAALRGGRMYAVSGHGGRSATVLKSVSTTGSRLQVACEGAAATFSFIGQDGRLLEIAAGVRSASYSFSTADTYVRTVIHSPDSVLYLNPVTRTTADSATQEADVDLFLTWVSRLAVGVVCAGLLALIARAKGRPSS
jgi:hypothetical protein